MNEINIKVSSQTFNFSCELHRRLTLVHGDSAEGKTTLVRLLSSNQPLIEKDCSLPIVVARDDSWREQLTGKMDSIILFDDLDCVETPEFATICSKYLVVNNLYIVIFGRAITDVNFTEPNENKSDSKLNRLAISVNEIYEFKSDGGIQHWLEPVEISEPDSFSDIDCIISEDGGSGYKFFNHYLENVYTVNGKDNVIKDLTSYQHRYNRVLVLLDLVNFGACWDEFESKFLRKGNVFVLPGRECFEQMLIQSNFLNENNIVQSELNNLQFYANHFISWEKYFEDLIKRATLDKFYCCTHGKHSRLSDCYLSNCSNCNIIKKSKCDFGNKNGKEDKFIQMFKGTIFDKLLLLPRKKVNKKTQSMNEF